MIRFSRPLIGIVAFSGTGKTTLLKKLIPILNAHGLRTGVVKHAHHTFDIDHPGKDSYELRHAGASQVAVASRERVAWIREYNDDREDTTLLDALSALDIDHLDLVIVEALGHPLLCATDNNIIALAADERVDAAPDIQQLDLNDANAIADFIISNMNTDNDDEPVYAT
jgi:molybdopterin-guanine dinucleotide biosynthesis protein MobB